MNLTTIILYKQENDQEEILVQDLEQLSQPDDETIQWMDMETFAKAARKTQQGVSYLINKGRLKEYRDEGIRIKKTDKWYLDATLVELVRSEEPLKTVEEKEALNNQLRNTQTALIKYREFEKRISTLEADNAQLVKQVQELVGSAEQKLEALESDRKALENDNSQLVKKFQEFVSENSVNKDKIQALEADREALHKLVQELSSEMTALRDKPWWRFW